MYNFPLIFSFVNRNIVKNRVISFLIILSLMLAVTAVLSTAGIFEGFSRAFEGSETGWLGDIVISPKSDETSIKNIREVSDRLEKTPNVESYSVRSGTSLPIRYADRWVFAYGFFGIDHVSEKRTTQVPFNIIEGSFFDGSGDADEVILGATLADSFIGTAYDGSRVMTGEKISLRTADNGIKTYTVRGIMDAKTFLPNWSVVMSKNALEKLGAHEKNNAIAVRLLDQGKTEETKADLTRALPSVNVLTWQENSGYISSILDSLGLIRGLIDTLLILVMFLITSIVVYIDVSHNKRQLGVIKAMGATNGFVRSLYLIQTVAYFLGAFLLGTIIFFLVQTYSALHPIAMQIGDFHMAASGTGFLWAFCILLAAALSGGLISTYYSTKTNIADVLRG